MKTKSFQEIYDFCKSDSTYRVYYDLPVWPHDFPSREKYEYYFRSFPPHGLSRAGTFVYHQGERQLCRFLGIDTSDRLFLTVYADWRDGQISMVDSSTYRRHLVSAFSIHASIGGKGVRIRFDNPFKPSKQVSFIARSHRPFNADGIFAEAITWIEKHLLLPPGRYRDLQLRARVDKSHFVGWYKRYRENEKLEAELRHQAMLDRYRTKEREPMTYNECYILMHRLGLFEELGADRYERHELASEFCDIMNR